MIVYWLLLLVTAAIAYIIGSVDTLRLASAFVFRKNLRKLGRGNLWISNFRRIYGVGGFIRLLLVEVVKDLLPVLIGGWLLSIKGHPEVGRAFAGFCLTLGRLYPAFYRFRGGNASFCLAVTAVMVESSIGIVALLFAAIGVFVLHYLSASAVAAAIAVIIVSILVLDDNLLMLLLIFTAALVLIKHAPAAFRMLKGKEEKLTMEKDLTYKLDQKF